MQKNIQYIPGIIVCILFIMVGNEVARNLGKLFATFGWIPEGSASPISGIFVAIILGMLVRNTVGLPNWFSSGIQFSMKYLLRAGIILLGLRLSLAEALKLGAWGIPLIVSCITVGLVVTLFFTHKLNQSERLGTLTACGTGICGVTAIMATAPVVKAKDDEISYAVANITIFGLVSMLIYPYIANMFFADEPIKAGLFLGTSIHDTAQVTGAALIYSDLFQSEEVVNVATVTKLTRNLFIILIIPIVSFWFFKKNKAETNRQIPKWYQLIPLFVIGFLIVSLLRTVGDIMIQNSGEAFFMLSHTEWHSFHTMLSSFGATYLLGAAMAGVGLSTDLKKLKGLGVKPFLIGLIAALSVSIVSFLLVFYFGHFITL